MPFVLQAAAVDVKLEDQQKINRFSRLNTRLHELEAQLAAKRVRRLPPDALATAAACAVAAFQCGHLAQTASPLLLNVFCLLPLLCSRMPRTWRRRATRCACCFACKQQPCSSVY